MKIIETISNIIISLIPEDTKAELSKESQFHDAPPEKNQLRNTMARLNELIELKKRDES